MASQTKATLGEILLRVYSAGRVEQLENIQSEMLSKIGEASDLTIGGDSFRFGINTKDDQSFGYHAEDAALFEPGTGVTMQASVTPKVYTGMVKYTGLAKAISSGNPHAFVNAITRLTEQKLQNMASYKEGALFRDGTGLLGTVNGAHVSTDTVINVNDPTNFRRGQVIDIIDPSNNKDGDSETITDVDWVNKTITIAAQVGTALDDGSAIYLEDRQTTFAGSAYEVDGLGSACATTGTYLGISRATYPAFASNVVNAGGAALSEDLLLRAENRPLIVGGVSASEIRNFRMIWHPNQRRQYFKLAIAQRQWTGTQVDLSAKLTWNGHEAMETFNCPETVMFLGDFSRLEHAVTPEGKLQPDSTGGVVKWIAGYDSFAMYVRSYDNYFVRKPNALVKVYNLQNVTNR